ncbi:N-acetylmuramoyl-L-alanine amidase [Candidatus Babeliales bacterium]|nr:N-acetylmuramoyl-L-alanine amidase [Candidatus Babeliales bacterium]
MKKFCIPLFFIISSITIYTFISSKSTSLIMIDPSGHAKNVGRKLVEGYERAQTFKFAEVLRDELKKKYDCRVVLTRFPGEQIFALQNASFANRLSIDFYLSLHFYREESAKPKLFIYNLVYDPIFDLAKRNFDPFQFVPIHQVHFINIFNTKYYGRLIREVLTESSYQKIFDFYGPYGIPIKPLCGIIAPAIAIEIGICQEEQWSLFVEPLVASLQFLSENKVEMDF